MGIYPKDLIENIRTISRSKIAKITTKHNSQFDDSVLDSNEYFLDEYPNIKNSIFSNDIKILPNDYIFSHNEIIYLLPPFSGG